MIIENVRTVIWGKGGGITANSGVYIADGKIKELGKSAELIAKYPEAERLDGRGQLLMPGNICAHTHFYGAFARGLGIPGEPPKDFPQILEKLWWPLDKALDEDSIRASTLVHLVSAIRNGTTSLIDHHASPNFIDGSLDVISQAVQGSGLRAVLCYEVSDRDGEDKSKAGISENLRFLKQNQGGNNGLVSAAFGLHASLSLEDETLEDVAAAIPDNAGFHIHVAEHEADQNDSLERSKMRVTQRLNNFGILRPESILAHAVHVDESEIELIANSQSWVSHQPRSNMNNGVGAADVEGLLNKGVRLCLGNDGFTQDMWAEWKAAYLMHKLWHRDPRKMNGMDIAAMAIENNAALISSFFDNQIIGEIKMGAAADLILVDYQQFTELNIDNLAWHILFGFQESMVTMTMVSGQVLMKDRELLTLDEERISIEALKIAPQVWARYEANVING